VGQLTSAINNKIITRQDGAQKVSTQEGGQVGRNVTRQDGARQVHIQDGGSSGQNFTRQEGARQVSVQDGQKRSSSERLAKRTATRPSPGSVKQLIAKFDQISE